MSIKGSLAFDRLLRIDGSFEGELRSSGDLVVGARGTLKGDIKGMNRVVVDGTVVGDIHCESLEVRHEVRTSPIGHKLAVLAEIFTQTCTHVLNAMLACRPSCTAISPASRCG